MKRVSTSAPSSVYAPGVSSSAAHYESVSKNIKRTRFLSPTKRILYVLGKAAMECGGERPENILHPKRDHENIMPLGRSSVNTSEVATKIRSREEKKKRNASAKEKMLTPTGRRPPNSETFLAHVSCVSPPVSVRSLRVGRCVPSTAQEYTVVPRDVIKLLAHVSATTWCRHTIFMTGVDIMISERAPQMQFRDN